MLCMNEMESGGGGGGGGERERDGSGRKEVFAKEGIV